MMEKTPPPQRGPATCHVCGQKALVHAVRDLPYAYKGRETVIAAVQADWCDACGECLSGPEETHRIMQAMAQLQRQVNAEQGTPAFITRVRSKLGLSQRSAGKLFGGGPNAFNRYESGLTQPPQALVQLLGLLDRRPELLDELR